MAFNIGVNVLEVDGRAAPTIVAAPISVAGFPVRASAASRTSRFRSAASATSSATSARTRRRRSARTRCAASSTTAARRRRSSVSSEWRHGGARGPERQRGRADAAGHRGRQGREDPGDWGTRSALPSTTTHARVPPYPHRSSAANTEPFALANGDTLERERQRWPGDSDRVRRGDFANIGAATAEEVAAAINRQTTALRRVATPTPRTAGERNTRAGLAARQHRRHCCGRGRLNLAAATGAELAAARRPRSSARAAASSPAQPCASRLRGHTVAPNAMRRRCRRLPRSAIAVDGGGPVTVTFRDADFANGVAAVTPAESQPRSTARRPASRRTHRRRDRLVLLEQHVGPARRSPLPRRRRDADATAAPRPHRRRAGRRAARASASSRPCPERTGLVDVDAPGSRHAMPAIAARIQSVEFDLVVFRTASSSSASSR